MKTKIGIVGVDAGVLMVGDPCYFFGPEKTTAQEAYPGGWSEICDTVLNDKFDESEPRAAQLNYAKGHAGLGVIVGTTHGDGVYPVYLETDDKDRRRLVVELE